MSKIIWTKTDEAPALATYSLLPIVNAFTKFADVDVVTSDISLASRVLSKFPERLTDEQKVDDELAKLAKVVLTEDCNIIKLPNISASVSQLVDCISELQAQGYDIPNYPEDPKNDKEKVLQELFSACLGSAVNPILREGNSDRRSAIAVKNFAKKNPHTLKPFSKNSKTYVAHMTNDDFYGNEQSIIKVGDGSVKIELNGKLLKELTDVEDKEIIDATYMSVKAFRKFLTETLVDAKEKGVLWSLHLKATMMKVSDPIMFGHAVEVFFKDIFAKYGEDLSSIEYNSNLGLSDLYKKIENLPADKKAAIEADIMLTYSMQPRIAMVDSYKGITNLHASNDIIIDASLPVVIRDGGAMWNDSNKLEECVCVIPDRCYAGIYKVCMEDCVKNGQYDVTTMGNVANVGLMAQKAEEYGSHPTTFEIPEAGTVKVLDTDGSTIMKMEVEAGDIWRMSRTKDIPIKNWVKLAVQRSRLTKKPSVFWLDDKRAHDRNMIVKVNRYLKNYDTKGLDLQIMNPEDAMSYSLKRIRAGKDTISVTGNVLRDYLTDLFPILELGTSAKMLSIVPLLAGGGLFETGAGGSAPKHVDQMLKEGHLRWDSLGEFLALAESLRFISQKNYSKNLVVITAALDIANNEYLNNNNEPSKKTGEPDNKASHYFLAKYWSVALASQSESPELATKFAPIAKALVDNEDVIIAELLNSEFKAKDIGGYFKPNIIKVEVVMRPSSTLNSIIDNI
jgi:isocitrate dehydrogenase